MENRIQIQTEKTLDADSLLAVSLMLKDISRIIRSIQMIAVLLLRYVRIGLSIANKLSYLIAPAV